MGLPRKWRLGGNGGAGSGPKSQTILNHIFLLPWPYTGGWLTIAEAEPRAGGSSAFIVEVTEAPIGASRCLLKEATERENGRRPAGAPFGDTWTPVGKIRLQCGWLEV